MTYCLVIALLSLPLIGRDPFYFSKRIQPIQSDVVMPRLDAISIDPIGIRLAIVHYGQQQHVVEEGERVGPWKIKAVSVHSVVIESLNGTVHTIPLQLEE